MENPSDRLRKAREAAGFESPTAAAKRFGWNEVTYRSHESGMRGLRPNIAARYGRAFKVTASWLLTGEITKESDPIIDVVSIPIRGEAAAGRWLEADLIGDTIAEYVPAIPGMYSVKDQFAFRIAGPSMDRKRLYDGDYVICVPYFQARTRLTSGDIVVIERRRGATTEYTCKEIMLTPDGVQLWPRSSDPRYQAPLTVRQNSALAELDGTEVEVVGLVIGRFSKF